MERGKNMCGVATCASYPDLGWLIYVIFGKVIKIIN